MILNADALRDAPEACANYIRTLSLEDRGDIYRAVREERLEADKAAARLKAFETLISESIIAEVPVDKGFVSGGYSFAVINKEVPTIKDWDAILAYIGETGRFDFLQKRLSDKAVTDTDEWWKLPGIQRFNTPKLSVTKR
jgi:hypothetical protein